MYSNYFNQPLYGTNIQHNLLKGRPVSSIDEARVANIDFDGSVFFFPDLVNNRIYTKQINTNGTSSFCMYELKDIPKETVANTADFVTHEELNKALEEFRLAPQEKFEF